MAEARGEFTIEWSPPPGAPIAQDAFAEAIGKQVHLAGRDGVKVGSPPVGTRPLTGTLVSAEVREDGRFARLTICASDGDHREEGRH